MQKIKVGQSSIFLIMLKKFFAIFNKREFLAIKSSTLNLTRKAISNPAMTVIKKLQKSGWDGFIVGGAVRDLLLNVKPKDFDIVTNARPAEVKELFNRARIIGRRFRIVHVYIGGETIEVSTFRKRNIANEYDRHGRLLRDNVFGNIEEDVERRDLTINSLYYDPIAEKVLDYHNGISDLNKREIVIIGNSRKRLIEDPIRIIRIIRLAAKLNLLIPNNLKKEMKKGGNLLQNVPKARLSDDLLKLFVSGRSLQGFNYILEMELQDFIFPNLGVCLMEKKKGSKTLTKNGFLYTALKNLDERVNRNKKISLSFIFTVLFWEKINERRTDFLNSEISEYVAMQKAVNEVFYDISQNFYFQRKHLAGVKELCMLQVRFSKFFGKSPFSLVKHLRFPSALKLFELRVKLNEVEMESVMWWKEFSSSPDNKKACMLSTMKNKAGIYKSGRRRKRKKKGSIN